MPEADFFSRLGVFAVKTFLDAESCQTILSEMISTQSIEPATITTEGIEHVDEAIRRTKIIRVSDDTKKIISERLESCKNQIEKHFQVSLSDCETPQFLAYKEGDFFKLHIDSSTSLSSQEYARRRRVSVVLFLNEESSSPDLTSYSGGSLILYGLIKQPLWENYGFNIQGKPGLLIAFAADAYHEVMPVTQGMRFTIVTWFPSSEVSDLQ